MWAKLKIIKIKNAPIKAKRKLAQTPCQTDLSNKKLVIVHRLRF
jgi:hypothetical protein